MSKSKLMTIVSGSKRPFKRMAQHQRTKKNDDSLSLSSEEEELKMSQSSRKKRKLVDDDDEDSLNEKAKTVINQKPNIYGFRSSQRKKGEVNESTVTSK